MKKCSICGINKDLSLFYFRRDNQKYRNECKSCLIKHSTEYNRINSIKVNIRKRDWERKHLIQTRKCKANWKRRNPEKVKEQNRKDWVKWDKKVKSTPHLKLMNNLRTRLNNFFKTKNTSRSKHMKDIIGCDIISLKIYIESKFKEGMNWENKGKWHIDHKIPLSSAKTEEEIYFLCHYTNLQPLWAKENLMKGNKLNYKI